MPGLNPECPEQEGWTGEGTSSEFWLDPGSNYTLESMQDFNKN